MSTFQVSDVQEKSSKVKVKANPGLRVRASRAKDHDDYSYYHVTTPLSANQIARNFLKLLWFVARTALCLFKIHISLPEDKNHLHVLEQYARFVQERFEGAS